MNDNNQLFTQYLTPLRDLKEILKAKDIILENNLFKNDMNSEDNKIKFFRIYLDPKNLVRTMKILLSKKKFVLLKTISLIMIQIILKKNLLEKIS